MRLQNWPHLLAEYLREYHDRPFVWGEVDCVQFAAGAVEVQTGVRPVLPGYRSELGARRLLRQTALRERVTAALGPEIPVARAQRGDLVLGPGDPDAVLGICMGAHTMFLGKRGLLAGATLDGLCAWRVG